MCDICRSIRVPAAVLAEEQMTLDVQTGAKSKPSRSTSAAGEGDEYGRPKVCDVRQLGLPPLHHGRTVMHRHLIHTYRHGRHHRSHAFGSWTGRILREFLFRVVSPLFR